jgi:hypothetical protein
MFTKTNHKANRKRIDILQFPLAIIVAKLL